MAQLLPMSEEMIASLRQRRWIARQAMRGLIQSGLSRAGALVPGGAGIVVLVIHRGQFLRPGDLVWAIFAPCALAARIAGVIGELRQGSASATLAASP
jgi:hypothetical protein